MLSLRDSKGLLPLLTIFDVTRIIAGPKYFASLSKQSPLLYLPLRRTVPQ